MFLNKKKHFLVFSFSILFFFIFSETRSSQLIIISGIPKVIDGDTIKIKSNKIRLFGIDAPEKKQTCRKIYLTISFLNFQREYLCGKLATIKLEKKINNKQIVCKSTKKDKYQRLIAECFKNKTNLNAWMVKNGYAVAYRKYSKKFISEEIEAKNDRLGLWRGSFEMPWDYRKRN
tara:strand:- start:154 stop:678 length:525 start_codon:yes stop_codon:yes gene_type:complete